MAVRYSNAFKRQLKRLARKYRHIRSDVEPVIDQLDAGERPGDQIQEIDREVYKVRVKNTDARRGKSGGYRILYCLQTAGDVVLVTIYSKSDQSDIDDAEVRRIIQEEEPG
jgi:mRNA-degrading endonuclease RelE of RelBE toxin-antitoxin system